MRLAIFTGLLLVARAIGPDAVVEDTLDAAIASLAIVWFLALDILYLLTRR